MTANGRLRIGWFTTARGQGSRRMFAAVCEAIGDGSLPARLAVVFCNREAGEDETTDAFFDVARDTGAPLVTLSSVRFRRARGGERSRPGTPLPAWREEYDREVARLIEPYPFDIGVLAGYMLIFTAPFVARHPLLNLHPALPSGPAGTWREVIRELIRARAPESGVIVHLAIPEVDAGPVAAFCRYPLTGPDFDPLWAELDGHIDEMEDAALDGTALFARIREAGLAVEAPFLVSALAAFADGRLRAEGGMLTAAHGLEAPLDLTAEVEARMRATAAP